MKKIFWLLILGFQAYAQVFSAITIPDSLKAKADAVVRYQSTEFVIKNEGEATSTVKSAITVLNKNGDDFGVIMIPYNKFVKVQNLEARLYDATGKLIKKMKKSDVESYSTSVGTNSIDDSYVKVARPSVSNYPYTIEFETEYVSKNLMFYPNWFVYPNNQSRISIEKSTFKIMAPAAIKVRYKELNMPSKVKKDSTAEGKSYFWEVAKLKAFEDEPYSPDGENFLPQVLTAPSIFEVEDYRGNLETWDGVAQFVRNLNQNRDKLDAEQLSVITDLVKTEADPVAKVKKVYEFLQNNTRYVSIQLGIGGWQTLSADFVAKKGYGDCKALTNYTQTMLKAIGIKSYMALVRAGQGEPDIDKNFPSFRFNHAILCVPIKNDTLWLECTSQTNPFGYLGSFTGNRHVLLINEDSGQIIKTPDYKAIENLQNRNATLTVTDKGEGTATIKTFYSGQQAESISSVIQNRNHDEQKKWIIEQLNLSSVELTHFNLNENKGRLSNVVENLNISFKNACTVNGSRLFLTLNQLNRMESTLLSNENRKLDIELAMNYIDNDTLTFELPAGYVPEFIPEPYHLKSAFGEYHIATKYIKNQVVYTRQYIAKRGIYTSDLFGEFVSFRKKISKADRTQIVLVKK